MSVINFGRTVSLAQAAQIVMHTPENRYLLQGEPGIGKSSLLATIKQALPKHEIAYIDVPNTDLGDVAMPVVDHEAKVTRYYPNSRFKMHTGKPVVVMLDEFTKGAEPVKNMLHPLLEVSNPRLGDIAVHPDSIIFLTGNLATDGVGDNVRAHTRNRIIPLTVRKPDAGEWLGWAMNHDIDPVIMAWVDRYPHAMASYLDDGQTDNPYIFNPKRVQTAFVSPRSLERASRVVTRRELLDTDSVICALTGAIGEAAARDMQAFIDYQDQLPAWDDIVKDPKKTKVPNSPGACAVLVFGSMMRVTKQTMESFMTYLGRMEPEWQACFAINVIKNPDRQQIAFSSAAFTKWVRENHDII